MPDAERAELRRRLIAFAEQECPGVSPLYAVLARQAAVDYVALDLAAARQPGQPPANILLAAVHALLLDGQGHDLATYYPDLAAAPRPAEAAGPAFADFCRTHRDALASIIAGRRVSTNEVQRSACLLPGFRAVAAGLETGRLHVIEVGASAGLNLYWDRIAYDYGGGLTAGAADAPLVLRCRLQGGERLDLDPLPTVASRVGIDLAPLDIADRQDMAWLRALIWPEEQDRVARLSEAVALARQDPPRLIEGDALACLAPVLACLPPGEPALVFHAFTLNQFADTQRRQFDDLLVAAGRARPLGRVGFEWGRQGADITVTLYRDGGRTPDRVIAEADPHGAWLRPLADAG